MGIHGNQLCLCLALSLAASVISTGCGDSIELVGTCYWLSDVPQNYTTAVQACTEMGGELAQLDKRETFDVITNRISPDKEFWVGLTSAFNETMNKTVFSWENNASPQSDQWIPGEPNKSGTCARLTKQYPTMVLTSHLLADHGCTNTYNYICQKPLVFGDCNIGSGQLRVVNGKSLCPISSLPALASIHCAVTCTLNVNCISYSFNITSGTCTLFQLSYSCKVFVEQEVTVTTIERHCTW